MYISPLILRRWQSHVCRSQASILADELTAALKATSYESHAISMPKNASPLVIFINPKV